MRYQFKSAVSRGTAFVGALLFLGGIGTPALITGLASADALNPLTERSLLLTSSAPGYVNTDGSGNTGTYAEPGSGPNGKQTGETFSFKTSTDSTTSPTLHAFTFQYCTSAAGDCIAPGNDTGAVGSRTDSVALGQSDLDVHFPSPQEGVVAPGDHASTDNFEIFVNGVANTAQDWQMTLSSKETTPTTGRNNLITLTSALGINPAAQDTIKVVFYGTDLNYITNPGAGAFFVKINDFDTATDADAGQPDDGSALDPTWTGTGGSANPHIVDGGVTVANVMNNSIQISTKVLETMAFSVGTQNPDTQPVAHGTCDAISVNNPISLGDPTHEYSLDTTNSYTGTSYWRLSSNSSNGATVYYSGYTLSNTEGDQIKAINNGSGTMGYSHAGTEQFGLGIDSDADTYDSVGPSGDGSDSFTTLVAGGNGYADPHLTPLDTTGSDDYGHAEGTVATDGLSGAEFAFKTSSNSVPEPIAAEATSVIHCSTAKMRYVANIAADTPAGIYTTKVNYTAAPEY